MNEGDIVKIRPNFARPSRIGQTAKIIVSRSVGVEEHNLDFQHWIRYDKDGLSDWVDERDLELIEENNEFDDLISEFVEERQEPTTNPNVVTTEDGRRVLIL